MPDMAPVADNDKWSKWFDIRPHCCCRRTVQSYSPSGANVPSHEGTLAPLDEYNCTCAQWRHLANRIELVLPLAHRQINRFSHFCTANGRVPSGTLAPHGEYDLNCAFFSPSSPRPKRQIDWLSHICTAHGRKSLYFITGAPFPKNCP